jgi:hypothetical protein
MLRKEKEELLVKLFEDPALFEKEVLGIASSQERGEAMEFLAHKIVYVKYQEQFNFLHIKNFSEFDLSPLESILFKELVHEFVSFCTDVLYLDKEEGYARVRQKENRVFLHAIAHRYFFEYAPLIYTQIAQSFIELILSLPHPQIPSALVEDVLQSSLVKNQNLAAIHSFEQLYKRVRAAHNYKNTEMSKLQFKVAEIAKQLSQSPEDPQLLQNYKFLKKKLDALSSATLDQFDAAIKRLKDTMINAMQAQNK